MTEQHSGTRATVGLSTAVFAQRDGKILLLKRAMGEATGAWYLPGGAVEPGETLEDAARRELDEEAGIAPAGPLTLIAVAPMRAYGADLLQVSYACDCPDGEVALSAEHSGFRWIDPREYRERYFNQQVVTAAEKANPHLAALMRSVQQSLNAYIERLDHQFLDHQLRKLRLTAEMFVVRDGKILILKRSRGLGEGVWYLPGGLVDPGEDPLHAAVRETREETGLDVTAPSLLRVWSYPAQNAVDAFHASYVGEAPDGDVALSEEHSDFRWIEPSLYVERYCSEALESQFPEWSAWFRQVRYNAGLVAARIEAGHPL